MVNVPLFVNVLEIDLAQAAVDSGLLLSALTATMALTAYAGGVATGRLGYRSVTAIGIAICALAFGLMGRSWSVETPYGRMALQLGLLGSGFGLVIAPVGAAVIDAAPDRQRGIAASLVILFRLMGMSVGLSALTGWGIYRFNILRRQVELPPLSDPGFGTALADGLTRTTAQVLAETFWLSAAVAVGALLLTVWLSPLATSDEGE
jgi:MFS family permease